MKFDTFGIFSVLTVAAIFASTGAEARIRKEKEKAIVAQAAKIQQKLSQMKYKPGNYVVRAIEVRVSNGVASLITDISPKVLTFGPSLIASEKNRRAIERSIALSKEAAKTKKKNEDFKGYLFITVTAEGVVTRLADLSNPGIEFKSEVEKLKVLEELKKKRLKSVNSPYNNTSEQFNASILATDDQLNALFGDVDPLNHDYMDLMDNCFNRSHYWARSNEIGVSGKNTETAAQQGGPLTARASVAKASIHSEKVFVFFTSRYQRQFKHKWWYHTAPTVAVQSADDRFVLDRSYTDGPMTTEEWVYTFASHANPNGMTAKQWNKQDPTGRKNPEGKIKCERIESLQDYYDQIDTGFCFWVEGVNMYTYTPNDLMSPNSETQWTCDSLYSVTQGVPYPKLPYGPRAKNASELIVGRESVEYNDYVVSKENQDGWAKANKGQFVPDLCFR